jgi:hypothetical protein
MVDEEEGVGPEPSARFDGCSFILLVLAVGVVVLLVSSYYLART